MKQPQELADEIRAELQSRSFEALVARFRLNRETSASTKSRLNELLSEANDVTIQLRDAVNACKRELEEERLVTAELHKLIADRDRADTTKLRMLEERNLNLHKRLIAAKEVQLQRMETLDAQLAAITDLAQRNGMTREEWGVQRAVDLLSHIPLESAVLDGCRSREERWQRLAALVAAADEPYVPIVQKYPQLHKFLA